MMETSKLKLSKFLALTLAFMMCFASIALANDPAPGNGPIPDPSAVTIKKILRMPTGTDVPRTTFEFEAAKISLDDVSTDTALASMPDLNVNVGNMALSISSADQTEDDTATNITTVTKNTGDIFAEATFPYAGVYVYEIKEKAGTNSAIDANKPNESLTYSDEVYTLRVYVANNDTYTGTFIKFISIIVNGQDDGQDGEVKVGQITFTNDYIKTNGPTDPEKPNPLTESTLDASKTVAGDLGNTEMYFDFTITPVLHALDTTARPYFRAYVVEQGNPSDVVVTNITENAAGTATGTDGNNNPYIQVATSGPTAFKLKHGQRLVFVDTPLGTSYTVDEAAAPGYIASYNIMTDGQPTGSGANPEANAAISTGIQLVGNDKNVAAFTNTRDSVVPTGINVNDLPFVGLIALPLTSLIGFIAIKSRKRNQAS